MTDDNKTTPPPAPGLDLDAVERAERAMTAGPWRHGSVERHHVFCSEGDRSLLCPEAGRVLLRMNEHFPHDSDAAGIVALRNAAPALIAEVRALRAEVAKLNDRETGWRDMVDDECRKRISAEYDARAEIARLTAELAAARAEVDCGQDGPCAQAPGCARHWQERNRELVDELAAARAVPADVEDAIAAVGLAAFEAGAPSPTLQAAERHLRTAIARAISDATAARGTVGGLLAAARGGEIVEWRSSTGRGWWQLRVRIDGNGVECRTCADGWPWGGWRAGQLLAGDMPRSARLVPAAEADADPSQRGPLPKGG